MLEFLGPHRGAKQVALQLGAACAAQEAGLLRRLDTLGRDPHSQPLGHLGQSDNDGRTAVIFHDTGYEGSIDLDTVHGQRCEGSHSSLRRWCTTWARARVRAVAALAMAWLIREGARLRGWLRRHSMMGGDVSVESRSAGRSEMWSFWELMGATTGPTRGELAGRIDSMGRNGWELALSLATVGTDGHWPHSMAVFRFADGRALQAQLEVGYADAMDERDIRWAKTRLARRLRGEFRPDHRAFLLEYVRCESRRVLEGYTDPDLVFADAFAPWQGIAMWGAEDIEELARREFTGIGSMDRPGISHCTGWWTVVPMRAGI